MSITVLLRQQPARLENGSSDWYRKYDDADTDSDLDFKECSASFFENVC